MSTEAQELQLGDISVEVVQKDIQNVHLSVYPPAGRVRIAAPLRMDLDTIRIFAISKLAWIRKQQTRFRNQPREAPREFLNRESHYYLGKRYLLKVIEVDKPQAVVLKHSTIELHVRPGTGTEQKQALLHSWYRQHLRELVQKYVEKWEPVMQVQVQEVGIKRMKTKWGTCNPDARRIWLNLELAKKPLICIEYIVVHEMVHLLERSHNDRFVAYMNKFMPQWPFHREELNRLPVSHADWRY